MIALFALALLAHAPKPLAQPWRELAPGVETASVADLGGDANWAAKVVLVAPGRATFAVRYDPSRPPLAEWRARYPNALAILNGSFYSTDGPAGAEVRPTCDLVSASRSVRGAGCHRQDALFFGARSKPVEPPLPARAVTGAAAPAQVSTRVPATNVPAARPLAAKPPEAKPPAQKTSTAKLPAVTASAQGTNSSHPRPSAAANPGAPQILAGADFHPEQWSEALKSFPALVHAGVPACLGVHYCAESSRTAAVAQLRDGGILLFASQWPAIRRDVGTWLAEDLGAVEALNLDGGPEATLALRGEPLEDSIGTQGVGLPIVIVVLPPGDR